MKICAISDMHGQYDFDVPECDILCIAGDIIPLDIQRYNGIQKHYFLIDSMTDKEKKSWEKAYEKSFQSWRLKNISWIEDYFIPWCERQKCNKVFLVGGNHDFFFESEGPENIKNLFEDTKIEYLMDEEMEYEGLRIYGSPWCHQFGRWAFMKDDSELLKEFEKIPEGIDVLITHDAPFGRTDLLLENEYHLSKGHIGNKPMTKCLEKLANPPKLHFTGHLHSCNHIPVEYDGTTTVCVSMLDERYSMAYKPFIICI